MRWLRSNIRGFARLALFSLAVQVIVTFGHVHLNSLASSLAQAVQSTPGGSSLVEADSKDQKSHGTADTDCPICALIQLASSSAPSVAAQLPVPATLEGTVLELPEARDFTPSSSFAFQARGPPAT